jgi:hypothetical protein
MDKFDRPGQIQSILFVLSFPGWPAYTEALDLLDAQSWMKNVKTLFKIANIVVPSLHMWSKPEHLPTTT